MKVKLVIGIALILIIVSSIPRQLRASRETQRVSQTKHAAHQSPWQRRVFLDLRAL